MKLRHLQSHSRFSDIQCKFCGLRLKKIRKYWKLTYKMRSLQQQMQEDYAQLSCWITYFPGSWWINLCRKFAKPALYRTKQLTCVLVQCILWKKLLFWLKMCHQNQLDTVGRNQTFANWQLQMSIFSLIEKPYFSMNLILTLCLGAHWVTVINRLQNALKSLLSSLYFKLKFSFSACR